MESLSTNYNTMTTLNDFFQLCLTAVQMLTVTNEMLICCTIFMAFMLHKIKIKFIVADGQVADVALDKQESEYLVVGGMDKGLASEESCKLADWEVHIDTDE